MGRKSHRRRSGDGEPFSWEQLAAEADGMNSAMTVEDFQAERRAFSARMDARFGPGAGDVVVPKVVHAAQVYARMLGLPPDEVARKAAGSWTLGVGWHEAPPPGDDGVTA